MTHIYSSNTKLTEVASPICQPRIACLEQFSGRNVGDAISLLCVMDRIRNRIPGAHFDIYSYRGGHQRFPTSDHEIRFIDLMPWRGTINYFGWPALRYLPQADWILTRGGRFFSNKLWHPYYNHMSSFRLLFPWLVRLGKSILLWDIGLGPLRTARSIDWAAQILKTATMITTRDDQSDHWVRSLEAAPPFYARSADPTWLMEVPGEDSLNYVATAGVDLDRPYVAVNVTSLVKSFPRGPVDGKSLYRAVLSTIRGLQAHARVWLVPTQVSDIRLCRSLSQEFSHVGVFPTHSMPHTALVRFLGGALLTVGMRYHSVVLSMLGGAPTMAIGYAPKVVELMNIMKMDQWCVHGDQLKDLGERVESAIAARSDLLDCQSAAIPALKQQAAAADECFDMFASSQGI